jgi:hypothetical protein
MKYLLIPIIFVLGYSQNLYCQNSEDTIRVKSTFWGVKHYQSDKKLSSIQVEMLYNDHPESAKLYRKGVTNNIISGVFGAVSGLALARSVLGKNMSESARNTGFGITITSFLVGLLIDANGNSQKKLAAKLYNDSIVKYGGTDKKMQINLVVTDQLGVGLQIGF